VRCKLAEMPELGQLVASVGLAKASNLLPLMQRWCGTFVHPTLDCPLARPHIEKPHSGFAPEALTTLPHFSISAAT
jgi:hypothetical protein